MSLRLVFVGFALMLIGGCSVFVTTDGFTGVDAVGAGNEGGIVDASDVEIATDPSTDGGDASVAPAVPDGGVLWPVNGHHYEVRAFGTAISWIEARDDAANSGGHLVTITSEEEAAFVWSLVRGRRDAIPGGMGPWIGAYQPAPESSNEPAGGWAWVTGEPWSYVNWQPSEPNDYYQVEHWAHLSSKGGSEGWNDVELSPGIQSSVIEYE
jgi:hypothetical protein